MNGATVVMTLGWCMIAQAGTSLPTVSPLAEGSIVAAAAVIVTKVALEWASSAKNMIQRRNGKGACATPGSATRCIEHVKKLSNIEARLEAMEKKM